VKDIIVTYTRVGGKSKVTISGDSSLESIENAFITFDKIAFDLLETMDRNEMTRPYSSHEIN